MPGVGCQGMNRHKQSVLRIEDVLTFMATARVGVGCPLLKMEVLRLADFKQIAALTIVSTAILTASQETLKATSVLLS